MISKLNRLMAIFIIAVLSASCQNTAESKKEITIGVQTYSFRTMEDQSPLAILEYIKESGVKHVELMGNHAEPLLVHL